MHGTKSDAPRSGATLMTASIMVLLLAVAGRSIGINTEQFRKGRALQAEAETIPFLASLEGRRVDGSDWSAQMGDQYTLIFTIPTRAVPSEISYWRAVLSQSHRFPAVIEFVAVCEKSRGCADHTAPLTTLSHMDPHQMHVLALAKRQRKALLYKRGTMVTALTISGDATELANELAKAIAEGDGHE
jgi:hypothetical protein